MSLIRIIKAALGMSTDTANNFVLDASADDGTMKLQRENGQDIMTVDAGGRVYIAQLGNYANDAAAAVGGVPVGALYRNGSVIQVRVS